MGEDIETRKRPSEDAERWGAKVLSESQPDHVCVACLELPPAWVFGGCGHVCLCAACARQYKKCTSSGRSVRKVVRECPVCRQQSALVNVQTLIKRNPKASLFLS